MVKNLPANAGDARHGGSILVGKIPWRRKQQPAPVFLSGKFHGQESLVGYSSWDCKESDTTEQLSKATQQPFKKMKENEALCRPYPDVTGILKKGKFRQRQTDTEGDSEKTG